MKPAVGQWKSKPEDAGLFAPLVADITAALRGRGRTAESGKSPVIAR